MVVLCRGFLIIPVRCRTGRHWNRHHQQGDAMSETAHETTETTGTVIVSDHIVNHWHRRERYRRAIGALRDTLVGLQGGQPVSTKAMRDRVVELLDALLDMETYGEMR